MNKKITFLMTAMVLILAIMGPRNVAWGSDVTYEFTPNNTTTGNNSTSYVTTAHSFTYDDIAWSFNQWNPTSLQIKTNQSSAGSEFNFKNTSAFPGRIKSVVITFQALTVSDASKLCFVGSSTTISSLSGGSAGTWNSTAKTLTWTPDNNTNFTYFAFYQNGKAASGTNYLANANAIVITYEAATPSTVANPTFNLAADTYYEDKTIELSAEEGCTIHYTLDGTTPTAESPEYSTPIQLIVPSTTTIKAIAVDGEGNSSNVASATYTLKRSQYTPEQLLAEVEPTSSGVEATVVFNNHEITKFYLYNSQKRGFYIETGEEDFLTYCSGTPTGWEVGGKVSGTVIGTWKTYSDLKEFCPANYNGFSYTQPTQQLPTPTGLTVSDLNMTEATLSWNAVEHASSYTVYVTDLDAYENTIEDIETTSVVLNNLTAGTEYMWTVQAIGDGETYLNSGIADGGVFETPTTVLYNVTIAPANGGTIKAQINSEDITQAANDATVNLVATPNTHFTFTSWNVYGTDEPHTAVTVTDNAFTMPAYNVTVTATFTEDTKYTVTYAKGGDDVTGVDPETVSYYENDVVSLEENPYTRIGFTFNGWEVKDAEENDVTVDEGVFEMPASNVTVTATWAEKTQYTVTYRSLGTQIGTEQVYDGDLCANVPTVSNIPTGFTFAGWTESESEIQFVANPYTPTTDVTLYAVFSREEGAIAGSGNYEKVTAQLTDWRGNYLIAYSSTIFADGRVGGTGGLGKQNQKVNPENNLSEDENTVSAQWGDTYHVTLENIEGSNTYLLKTQDGKYNYQSSNANGLASTTSRETAAQYPITVNFASENEINLALGGNAAGAVFRYNTDGYFRYYKNCGQSKVYFYKKDEGTPGTLHYYTRVYDENTELASLEVAGPSIILSGYTLTVTGTLTNTNAANLVIEDGGQLICNNEVDATVKKRISAINGSNGWYTIASPVKGSIDAPTAMTSSNEYDLYYYDEPEYTWRNHEVHGFQLDNEKGYLYANGTATNIEFAGTLRAGNEANVVVNLSYASTYQKLKGFNLVGNPFAHNIIMGTNAIMTNGNTGYYVVENGSNLLAKTSDPIKPCQGFMVQATGGGQTITFNPSAKETQTEHEYITIAAGNGDFMDMAYICTNADEKLGKITLDNPTAKVYLQQNGNDYAIAPLGEATSMVVCFKAPASGTYTINVSSDHEGVSLKDMKTGYVTAINHSASYTFEASENDAESRFKIMFGTTGVEENGAQMFVFQSGSNLIISGEGCVQIIDMMGRVLHTAQVESNATVSTEGLTAGAYVVRMLTANGVQTQKVIVK